MLTPGQWRMALNEGGDESQEIREATYSGRPHGSEQFVTRLEGYLRRRLRRGRPGRPRSDAGQIARAFGGEM